ncbi:glycosyltransferase family 2 protein [Candidatus Micrarchaeota archaeon]|nr:glycosyltransferase family 2 protein [Candidatus Micrarchaeota archaeon]MBU1931020.1 glycosyltransferase family 2 protein [Candidatus Micrarchaeota archaeon]
MKLIITIPAFNEEKTIGQVIHEIPKSIPKISSIRVLVIDDGSTDQTAAIARKHGAIVLSHATNQGLAKSFRDGLNAALEMNTDIIVNTDGDMQYNQKQIPLLVKPIVSKKSDIVLGSRFAGKIESMSWRKRMGNKLATKAVALVSGIPISDGQTGFRAFSKEAALRLNVLSDYTYTQETIIQAAYLQLRIKEVPIEFRKRADESRLISSMWGYAKKSAYTLLMGYLTYHPFKVFLTIGSVLFAAGFLFGLSVLIHFFSSGLVAPYFPTALLSVGLMIFGFQIVAIGLVAEMIKNNRKIEEDILYRIKKQNLNQSKKNK